MELTPEREQAREVYRERIMAYIAGTAITLTEETKENTDD